ncbi:acylphosphatase [Glaciihabitans tibetensis]|uniref:acylphosphatase n=1 Tax=Glaciihabitans tibetensis TaxID=1266600 RepID=UPI001C63627C|nr:acylphosphatase [Glaciihabitans tibetensis]
MIRKHAVVRGQVQGSGFRYYTQTEAIRRGLRGYVRDSADGSIEVEVEGDDTTVEDLIDWLKVGPTWAKVEKVEVAERLPSGRPGFHIL